MAMASTSIPAQVGMGMDAEQKEWYFSLLGFAEHFRTSKPPDIKLCIQCLQGILNFQPRPRQDVEARTHFQLGNILLTCTNNTDLARAHLEQAWTLSQEIANFDDVTFESASVLAIAYAQLGEATLSRLILKKAIKLAGANVYWCCRLIFQLLRIYVDDKNYTSACSLLDYGVRRAERARVHYTKVLFLLSKGMILLIEKSYDGVAPLLEEVRKLVVAWKGSPYQKEHLKVYYFVLQICQYITAGQPRSVKSILRELQESIQKITGPTLPSDEDLQAENMGEMFMWMPKEHLCVLTYLITAMHSVQGGYMEKAQKYIDKALIEIEHLKTLEQQPILNSFQLLLLEQIITCKLIMGNKTLAIKEISQACALCQQHPRLLLAHKAPLHTLIGLYAMEMNCMEAAEAQFSAALQNSEEKELWTFVHLNLAIIYIRTKNQSKLLKITGRINPENLPSRSVGLRAAAYYVQALQSFFQSRFNNAKNHSKASLKIANDEDMNRLTSCSLMLLAHSYLSLGSSRESHYYVNSAMHLASKIPDVHVKLWAATVLRDLHRLSCDLTQENTAYTMYCKFTQMMLKDRFSASQLPEHNLIHWTGGEFPVELNSPPRPISNNEAHGMGNPGNTLALPSTSNAKI